MRIALLCLLPLAIAASDRQAVSTRLKEQAGHPLRAPAEKSPLPPGVSLDAPLSADDCVAIALWNNAQLEADLSVLAVAQADVKDARGIRDPFVQILIPAGPKRFESVWTLPLDLLIQRPQRIRAAEASLKRVTESVVQNGLNLARDVRVAHADLTLAESRAATGGFP